MIVRVISPVGSYICKYGSRKQGETFDNIPDELALELCQIYPNTFELVEPPASEPPEDEA